MFSFGIQTAEATWKSQATQATASAKLGTQTHCPLLLRRVALFCEVPRLCIACGDVNLGQEKEL